MKHILKWMSKPLSRRGFVGMMSFGLSQLILKGIGWTSPVYIRVDEFLVRSVERTQRIDLKTWRLKVEGLVERPVSLRFDEVRALTKKTTVKPFICVEGWGLDDQKWEGTSLKEIFSKVKISPKARFVTFHSTGGIYKDSLSIQEALEPDTLLAYKLNGKDLLPENGFPLRLVIPRMYGYKGPKWVERIVFTENQEAGYWERFGYPVDGSIPGLKQST